MRLERVTVFDKIAGKGIDIVYVLTSAGKIINKHVDHLGREDLGGCQNA